MKMLATTVLLTLTLADSGMGQWSTDPAVNTAVCTAAGDQASPQIISDGAGGFIIVWEDGRNPSNGREIYAQRFDADGNGLWGADGAPVCTAFGDQVHPRLCSDDSSGAIVVWEDYRDCILVTCGHVYAQRILADGSAAWAADGIRLGDAGSKRVAPEIVPDGSGGAIVGCVLVPGLGAVLDVEVHGLTRAGAEYGAGTVCSATGSQFDIRMAANQPGEAIMVWRDTRTSSLGDLYAQRVRPIVGDTLIMYWGFNGIPIATRFAQQWQHRVCPDGEGGAVIAYTREDSVGLATIVAQRVAIDGSLPWASAASGGISASGPFFVGDFDSPAIVSSGDSLGTIIAWSQLPDQGIRAQRMSPGGTRLWGDTPVLVVNAAGSEQYPAAVSDSNHGAIVCWQDTRNGALNPDLYAQRLGLGGARIWRSGGVAVSTNAAVQGPPAAAAIGDTTMVAAWVDDRNGPSNNDIYCNMARAAFFLKLFDGALGDLLLNASVTMNFTQLNPPGTGFDVSLVEYALPPDPCAGPSSCFDPTAIGGVADQKYWTIESPDLPAGTTFTTDITFTFSPSEAFSSGAPDASRLRIATRDSGGMFTLPPQQFLGPCAGAGPCMITVNGVTHFSDWILAVLPETATYRSFEPESIAAARDNKGKLGKAVKRKADKVEFCLNVTNDLSSSNPVTGLHIEFSHKILDSTLSTAPGYLSLAEDGNAHKWNIEFPEPVDSGTDVTVCGFGDKGMLQKVSKYWWVSNGSQAGAKRKNVTFTLNQPRLPMPDLVNVLDESYRFLLGPAGGLVVGIPNPDKKSPNGWVRMKKSRDVLKSLTGPQGQHHTGDPAAFNFGGEKKTLPPTVQDNRLFAHQVGLKLSIAASDAAVTAPGFGEIVYDDSTGKAANPLNGNSLRRIGVIVDSLLSGYTVPCSDCVYGISAGLDSTLEKIVGAFSGPVDTVAFGSGLVLKGVARAALEIPYLHPPSGGSIIPVVRHDATAGDGEPDAFRLDQNYPNPFNPQTVMTFYLPAASRVTLTVYNVLGQEVAIPINGELLDEGNQEVEFDGAHLPSGVYFYRLTATQQEAEEGDGEPAASFTAVRKMLLMK